MHAPFPTSAACCNNSQGRLSVCLCVMLQVLDLHAERVMYHTVVIADTPQHTPAAEAMPSNSEGCTLLFKDGGLAAATAALSALQGAAGAAHAQLVLPSSSGSNISMAASAGLPGLLKSWAAETGSAMVAEQQQTTASMTLQLAAAGGIRQPACAEQEAR